MRLSASSIVPVVLVMLVIACNTFDPDSCFPNTSGGFGGSETIPIGGAAVGAGSGEFATPPHEPLDYGGAANPCIEPQSACNQKCESHYNTVAAECGSIQDAAQRKTCQDAAYAAYMSCRESCQHGNGDDCREYCKELCYKAWEKCRDDCPKNDGNCRSECTNTLAKCNRECDRRCK